MSQFTPKRFARGVRATVQHVYDPLDEIATAASTTEDLIKNVTKDLGTSTVVWNIPYMRQWGPTTPVSSGMPDAYMPFLMPPFQQEFNRATLAPPDYQVVLRDLSVSIDQRAEALGVTSPDAATQGLLTACDMTRYTVTIKLFERSPWGLTGVATSDLSAKTELLTLEVPGDLVFGNEFTLSPFLQENLNITIKPFKVYFWEVYCPGLPPVNVATSEELALVSFTLRATFTSPLTTRDSVADPAWGGTAPGIQNIPTKHNGSKTGTTIPVVTPAADAIITGTDLQTAYHEFDETLRRRLPSGYGTGAGALGNPMQSADAPPTELLLNDACYHMIVVPMWSGQQQGGVKASQIGGSAVLPYMNFPVAGPPYTNPCIDTRLIPVPDNFVLHHAFAVWNNYWPNSVLANNGARATVGGPPLPDPDYIQKIGIALNSGGRSDNYRYQQVAYFEWAANLAVYVDYYQAFFPSTQTLTDRFSIVQIPLVWPDVTWDDNSYEPSGQPFFMGTANTTTAARTNAGVMPGAFGGGAMDVPLTEGQERHLEVRWTKERSAGGTGLEGGVVTSTRVGWNGEWIILCGKKVVGR